MAPPAGSPSPAPFSITSRAVPNTRWRPISTSNYTKQGMTGAATYRPRHFTRLPNRYYSFRKCRALSVFRARLQHFQNPPLPGQGSGKGGQKRRWLRNGLLHQQKAETTQGHRLGIAAFLLQNTEPGRSR